MNDDVAAGRCAIDGVEIGDVSADHLDGEARDAWRVREVPQQDPHPRPFLEDEPFDETAADEPGGAGHENGARVQSHHAVLAMAARGATHGSSSGWRCR